MTPTEKANAAGFAEDVRGVLETLRFPVAEGAYAEGRLSAVEVVTCVGSSESHRDVEVQIIPVLPWEDTAPEVLEGGREAFENLLNSSDAQIRADAARALRDWDGPRLPSDCLTGWPLLLRGQDGTLLAGGQTDQRGRVRFPRVPTVAVCRIESRHDLRVNAPNRPSDAAIRTPGLAAIPSMVALRWRKPALAAAAVLVFCGLAWAGAELHGKYVRDLQEIARLRQEATKSQAQYDQAWSAMKFEEIVKPIVRVLSAKSDGKPGRVRVELSPRIEEGLVRDVSVSWGDAGDVWEPVYEAQGTAKGFQAVHEYPLPPIGQTRQWTLRVLYAVPDAVASARRLTPDLLTSACHVEATADGIRLLAGANIKGAVPELAAPGDHELTWLSPLSGSEVGWKVRVTLQSPTTTELVRLLVRPVSGNTFYVQSGARRLPAGIPESFDVQLGGGPESAIGADFDILVVCGNSFAPNRWSLDVTHVPHSAVIARITVRKEAGAIRMVQAGRTPREGIGVEGAIWTSHGGALLMKKEGHYRVLKTFPPSIDGHRFSEFLTLKEADYRDVYLLVHREDESALQVGQTLPALPTESWLYKCRNIPDDVQRKPLEQGEGR